MIGETISLSEKPTSAAKKVLPWADMALMPAVFSRGSNAMHVAGCQNDNGSSQSGNVQLSRR